MRRARAVSCPVALFLLAAAIFCRSPAMAGPTALDAVLTIAKEGGFCVLSPLTEQAMRDTALGGSVVNAAEAAGTLEANGLSVFQAGEEPLVVVTDLRSTREFGDERDDLVLASELLAALPSSVLELQRQVVRSTTPPSPEHFPLQGLPSEVQDAAARLAASVGRAQEFAADASCRVKWQIASWLRDDGEGRREFKRAWPPGPFFREPPIGLDRHRDLPASHLPWALWQHANSRWAAAPCAGVPQGDTTLGEILDTLRREPVVGVTIHPSSRLASERELSIAGQPPTVGALIWGLAVCCGIGCRDASDDHGGGEVFYALRPRSRDLEYTYSLPGRGYVSPLRTRVVETLLAESDYGRIIPLHACWPLADLPPIYAWGRGEETNDQPRSMIWVRYVNVALLHKGGYGGVSFDLPIL